MNIYTYDNLKAIEYAKKWAYSRNPIYFDFERLGGDCTNFVSQCVFAGCGIMNYTPVTGWYYNSLSSRAPAWTGVNEFFNFITTNKGVGPFAKQVVYQTIELGDVIQLYNGRSFYHTVIVTKIQDGEIYTSSHTRDTYNKRLTDYSFVKARFLKILGYRK